MAKAYADPRVVAIVQKRWDEIPPPVDKKKRMYYYDCQSYSFKGRIVYFTGFCKCLGSISSKFLSDNLIFNSSFFRYALFTALGPQALVPQWVLAQKKLCCVPTLGTRSTIKYPSTW